MFRAAAFVSRWGFALLVSVAGAIAVGAAVLSPPPDPVPDFALRAAAVYRIEIGAAVFALLYLASLAFVLALHNRGFSEIGTGSVKAASIAGEAQAGESAVAQLATRVDRVENELDTPAPEKEAG